MKTITDIKENVELLHTMDRNARMETEKKYKAKIFAYYKDVPEIVQLANDLDNCVGGEYSFDNDGDLIYGIEVKKDIATLPEIGSFLESYFGNYKDGTYYQWCGDFISVNRADPKCYYVYDHGTNKPLLKERPSIDGNQEITEENYLRAKIELYMRESGQFNDVVEVDYYGSYVQHFDMSFPEEVTDDELKDIVNKFEQGDDDE